jgi:serine/threonine protein kinase
MINRERDENAPVEWDDTQKLIVLYGTAVALKLLHSHNVIHRNLNPKAVLLDDDLEPKLGSFAFAKYFDPEQPLKQSMHGGTPLFMAPEILKGEDFGISGDVFAFGILIYFAVAKLICFDDSVLQYCHIDPSPEVRRLALRKKTSQMPASANQAYGELMERCCKEDPLERPTFQDIVKAMELHPSRFGQIDTVRFRRYQAKILP